MIVEKTACYQLSDEEVNTLKKAARILDSLGDATRHNFPYGVSRDISLIADGYKLADASIFSSNDVKADLNTYKYWK